MSLYTTDERLRMIYIYHTSTGWVASFRDSDQADTMLAVLGTTEVPTPYTATADANVVLSGIRKRNPGYTVVQVAAVAQRRS